MRSGYTTAQLCVDDLISPSA